MSTPTDTEAQTHTPSPGEQKAKPRSRGTTTPTPTAPRPPGADPHPPTGNPSDTATDPALAELATARLIPLDAIDQNHQLIRTDQNDDEIIELAASIAEHGLLQPIGVARRDGGRFQLLWGARRFLAHQRLRRPSILAIIRDDDDTQVRTLAIVENLQRRDLSIAEECQAVAHLHLTENLSPDQVACRLGKSRAWVMRRLSVPALPIELRVPVLEALLPIGHAEELSRLNDVGLRAYALQQVTAGKYTLSQCRALVQALQASDAPPPTEATEPPPTGPTVAPAPLYSPCAACGTPRPLADLELIRVCRAGCATDKQS